MDGDGSVVESGGRKLDRIQRGAKGDVWIDPQGYRAAVQEREHTFETELARQARSTDNPASVQGQRTPDRTNLIDDLALSMVGFLDRGIEPGASERRRGQQQYWE
jgi:hypothetical protein